MSTSAPSEFEPDSQLVGSLHPSPNVNARIDVQRPTLLILHYTGLPTVERSITVLADPACQVSCHYVIDERGRITQMVPEGLRAWHAGLSYWQGQRDINSMSIGIEIQNPGHDAGYPDFPPQQMSSVIALAQDIIARYAMRPQHVLAHSDVAPMRKKDPGEKFGWSDLAAAGVGHWVSPAAIDDGARPAPSAEEISYCQSLLQSYGYDCPLDDEEDGAMRKTVVAFQRHFRPARVDGRIDHSTINTLEALLDALPDSESDLARS